MRVSFLHKVDTVSTDRLANEKATWYNNSSGHVAAQRPRHVTNNRCRFVSTEEAKEFQPTTNLEAELTKHKKTTTEFFEKKNEDSSRTC